MGLFLIYSLGSLMHQSVVVHHKNMSSTHSLSDLLSIKSIEFTDSSKKDCYKCNVCDEVLYLEHLKTHMEAHTKTSLVCDQCDKSFRSRGGLEYHMLARSGKKNMHLIF